MMRDGTARRNRESRVAARFGHERESNYPNKGNPREIIHQKILIVWDCFSFSCMTVTDESWA
jgi:hypothetical protein